MDAQLRYPELFPPAGDRTPESFWTSLRYFNWYRITAAVVFLATFLVYDDLVGRHWPEMFRVTIGAYLLLGVVFQAVMHRWRERFSLQLSVHVATDIVAITLLTYASGGLRSGLGMMLVISLIASAIVARPRMSLLYAAVATIALLLEQGYWVLAHDAEPTSFLQPGLLAMGCFATVGVTSWLAQRVAANEALALQRGRRLATQTRINQLVIEDMHDGVLVLDREGRIAQHNPQAVRLLGADALLGRPVGDVLPGFGSTTDFEIRGRHIGARMLDAGSGEPFTVVFLEDTTRSREQAQQLKLAALGRLTANIAHEIRNPLAAISHAAELLSEEKRAGDKARLTRIIRDNTVRLERLVSDVLQLNRRDRVAGERIELASWLPAFVAEFVANESVPADRFAVDCAPHAAIEFDREHLHQVMWNLLRNAVRHARAEPAGIRLVARSYAGRVELSVMDNGPGVPPASQGQLFEPFFTTDSKGTGLGLYLARELCMANRALLEYVNQPSGAHFRIVAREARA